MNAGRERLLPQSMKKHGRSRSLSAQNSRDSEVHRRIYGIAFFADCDVERDVSSRAIGVHSKVGVRQGRSIKEK